ncbi:hypothetical protein [Methylomonas sp. CM2]|uniref:hypothetical protein n=1 Tax=Methylomonas sp. CM2 TaxID=3417647 RepID=UPI003CF0D7C5
MKNANKFIAAAAIAVLGGAVILNVTNASSEVNEDKAATEGKSVAWYVANIKEAKAQNQTCHDNPNLQASADCVNSLHALQISFKGGN